MQFLLYGCSFWKTWGKYLDSGTKSCYSATGKVIAALPNIISQNGYTIDILYQKKKKYNLSYCTSIGKLLLLMLLYCPGVAPRSTTKRMMSDAK